MKFKYLMNHNILIILLLLSLPLQINSLVINRTFTSKSFLTTLDFFGFDAGGQVTVVGYHQAKDVNSVRVAVCDHKTYLELEKNSRLREKFCTSNSAVCTTLPLDGKVSTKKISLKDIYAITAINCNIDNSKNKYLPVVVNLSVTALNHGSSHLSYGQSPLPIGFLIILISFVVLGLIWCIFLYKIYPNISTIHKMYTGLILLKLLYIVIVFIYWKVLERRGTKILTLQFSKGLLVTIIESFLFYIMLLIAKGYKIIYDEVDPLNLSIIPLPMQTFFFIMMMFTIYNNSYYFLFITIMYILLTPKIFSSISDTLNILSIKLWAVQLVRGNSDAQNTLKTKIFLYKAFRIAVIVYTLASIIMYTTVIFITWYYEWFPMLAIEIISFAIFTCIMYMLSPHHSIENLEIFAEDVLQELINNPYFVSALRNRNELENMKYDVQNTEVIEWPDRTISLGIKQKVK